MCKRMCLCFSPGLASLLDVLDASLHTDFFRQTSVGCVVGSFREGIESSSQMKVSDVEYHYVENRKVFDLSKYNWWMAYFWSRIFLGC